MKEIEQIYPKESSPCNYLNIRRAARAVAEFYDKTLAESGLTAAQLGLLSQVEIAGAATIGEISKRTRIDRTTINRNMKPLIAAGLAEIVQGEDLRTKRLSLTIEGKEKVAQAYALWKEAQASLGRYLGEEDLAKLTALLAKIEAITP